MRTGRPDHDHHHHVDDLGDVGDVIVIHVVHRLHLDDVGKQGSGGELMTLTSDIRRKSLTWRCTSSSTLSSRSVRAQS